jgi:spermidine synthase
MVTLFTLAIFWGATLLFVVQPLFGRLVLPLLGGAPAVWNTCLVFFQAMLLAGYGYAHWLATRVRAPRQVWWHGALVVAAAFCLPIAIPADWTPPVEQNPIPWLLGAAALTVGLPFFVVSATSPLLQRWFAATNHPRAGDPYFLYAASNAGSLLALLSYPVLVEPRLGLLAQSRWWAAGFAVLAGLIMACGWVARRGAAARPVASTPVASEPIRAGRRVRWVLLALAPSSLMMSVTNYISMDIAAIPLLWVVPLALYLGTFALAFARRQWPGPTTVTRLFQLLLTLVAATLALGATEPLRLLIPLHLAGLFAAGLMCHRELAADRPALQRLTEFYFWIAVGGVLGGAFNALVAPVIFPAVWEYPLGLVLAASLAPRGDGSRDRRDWLYPAALLVVSAAAVGAARLLPDSGATALLGRLPVAIPAVVAYSFVKRRLRFTLGLAVVLLVGAAQARWQRPTLWQERSFFGIHRVDQQGELYRLLHGSTVHGAQHRAPERRREPVLYYAATGPLGQIMAQRLPGRVAAVGLGTGVVLCYAQPGDEWTYFEIDPVVERIARDERFFTYLADAAAPVTVVLGDARLTLRHGPDAGYQLLILDAYNSDAIPLHLITREAVALYRQKLQPGGLLVWHLTNRHMELEPVVAALAAEAGWVCRIRNDRELSPAEAAAHKAPSKWAVMAAREQDLGALAMDPRWRPASARPGERLWTDDYTNLFGVLRR